MDVSGQLHAPGRFTPGEIASGTHRIGGWVEPRAGLDAVKKRKISGLTGNRTSVVQVGAKSLY
jgi:hypothetical protein